MKQAIAGVTPAESEEVTVMVVWPSVASLTFGRWLGRQLSNRTGFYIFRVGNFLALASAPIGLVLYFYRLLRGSFYKLTNRRVVERRFADEVSAVNLDDFDTIDIVRQPGQEWYDAGDLVFQCGDSEVLCLRGVSRPEAFRQTLLKSRMAYVGVKQVLSREAAGK